MKEFQEKKKIKKFTKSKLFLAVLLFFTFLLVSSAYDLFYKRERVIFLRDSAKNELSKLEEKNEALREKTEALKTPYGVEKVVREKYDAVAPGEEVIVVLDKQVEEQPIIIPKSSWEKFLDFLHSLF